MDDLAYLNRRIGILEATLSSLLTFLQNKEAESLVSINEIKAINYGASKDFDNLEAERNE